MDKALLVSLLPFFALLLLVGVVALHIRKGKRLDLRLEGLGIKLSLHSKDKETKDAKMVANKDQTA